MRMTVKTRAFSFCAVASRSISGMEAVELGEGEFMVVPRTVEHRPRSLTHEPVVLMFEPGTTINTGNADERPDGH